MSLYLLDTNILSEPLKPLPDALVMERLEQYTDDAAIAAVTFHEMRFGALRLPPSHRREQIERYLWRVEVTFPILPYDASAAEWHATERARLTGLGRPPVFVDGQIAAIAATNSLILVTRNLADFEPFQGLPIENWFV